MAFIGIDDLFRFTIGGLVVASVPVIARSLSPAAAGVLGLVPAPLLLSFAFLGMELGSASISKAAVSAMFALPTLFVFLFVTYGLIQLTGSVVYSLLGASLGWLLSAWGILALYSLGHNR